MTPTPIDELADAVAQTADLVDGIRDEQWELPTPCAKWSVRELVDHLVLGHRVFAHGLLGGTDPASAAGPVEGERGPAYRTSAADMLAAFRSPGALERPIVIPFGTVPGSLALHLRLVEALVHGWDVARATGQPLRGDEGLAERALERSRPMLSQLPPGRQPFGPSRPASQSRSAVERLAALLGRDVDGHP